MIVVDASALVAVGDGEPEADAFLGILLGAPARMSSINYVETGRVLIGRRRLIDQADLDEWLTWLGVLVERNENLGPLAMEAYLTFGRGYHPAGLNLGDCFAYALAKHLDAPLLYKGNDFPLTDVRSALQPT